ncbi:MAG: NAD(P)/FAD-dependent oxidoreductase [Verrucomicrobiota bacterium]
MKSFNDSDLLVIGGGAAGLFCASIAGRLGRSVTLLERNDRVGMKILISGGGRCNFTNLGAGPKNYLSSNPNFCKSALARFKPDDFIAIVHKHGIAFHEKKLGQQFCNDSSRRIVDLLLGECEESKVRIECDVQIDRFHKEEFFEVETSKGVYRAKSLVIATGALSFPKLGSTDFAYRVAKQFGIPLTSRVPGLVPLTFIDPELRFMCNLSGVSLPVKISCGSSSFLDDLLFTHRGLSGPSVLQISSYWKPGESIEIDLLPGLNAAEWLAEKHQDRAQLSTVLGSKLPARFAKAWVDRLKIVTPLGQIGSRRLREIGAELNHWKISPSGTEGYPKAEVTVGGIDTGVISSKTMECRDVAGLYFIGEALDVTGHLGGYNFQWAWASAHAAGEAIGKI